MTAAVLVDTHILLWMRTAPPKLSDRERQILDEAQLRYVSAVNVWEIALLMSLGRVGRHDLLLDVPEGFDLLPIRPVHCRAMLDLPRHHRDPFDRMLIAQAVTEQLPLLTRDRAIARYRDAGAVVLDFADQGQAGGSGNSSR